MFELISDTVTAVGTELFDSRAVYNTAQSFSMILDGCSHSFTETKRTSNDDLASYEVRAEKEDIFRREPGPIWHPVLWAP